MEEVILKITGTWKGDLEEVLLERWTVVKLREEVATRCNCAPNAVKLIWASKILEDREAKWLDQLGLQNKSKILAYCPQDPYEFLANERAHAIWHEYLAFTRDAVSAMAERNADTWLRFEDCDLQVEDQTGTLVCFPSEEDHRAAIMGLFLQTTGKFYIAIKNYELAIHLLQLAEEAFNLCDPNTVGLVDNVSMLQIDIVWCYFMLRDIKSLSDAEMRLEKAREGIDSRARGNDSFGYPELALVLRLEVLEAVVAYHTGQLNKSKQALNSAFLKLKKLKLPDEALSRVTSFGFSEGDAAIALRIHNHDVEEAIDFLVEMKTKKLQRKEKDNQICKRKRYRKTALKIHVNLMSLKTLVSKGFQKELAAAALRKNGNDILQALSDLRNPETKSALQVIAELWKRKRIANCRTKIALNDMVEHGFERSKVAAAFDAGGTLQEALRILAVQYPKGLHGSASSSTRAGRGASPAIRIGHAVARGGTCLDSDSTEEPYDDSEAEPKVALMLEGILKSFIAETHIFKAYDHEVILEERAIAEYVDLLHLALGR